MMWPLILPPLTLANRQSGFKNQKTRRMPHVNTRDIKETAKIVYEHSYSTARTTKDPQLY